MQKKQNPSGGRRRGFKKEISDREDTTRLPLAVQGFCAPCAYFRAVLLESGRVRRVCAFSGERLTLAGDPLCEFMTLQEVADA